MKIKALLVTLAVFVILSKEYLLFNDTLVIIAVFATVFCLLISNFDTTVSTHIADVCTTLNKDYSLIFKKEANKAKSFTDELCKYLDYNDATCQSLYDISDNIICA